MVQSFLTKVRALSHEEFHYGSYAMNEQVLWNKLMDMRFLLQKAFSTSNKLPKDPAKVLLSKPGDRASIC